ncbi:MAG: DUF5658 family protein [bacterium]
MQSPRELYSEFTITDQSDRRLRLERRVCPTPAMSRYSILSGQREGKRRINDPSQVYVDRYSHRLLLVICLVLLLCILDGYFTLFNVFCLDIPEFNPIMAYLLNRGVSWFFLVKYWLTSLGLIFLCVRINFRFTRLTLMAIFGLYLLVLCSHLYIFSSLASL